MIEIRKTERLIAIDKKTSTGYYTFAEAIEIKRRLNELFPDALS